MRTDFDYWQTYPLETIISLFDTLDIQWGIGGGVALDLYYGFKTRNHEDIDIIIFVKDAAEVIHLLQDFSLFKAENGILTPYTYEDKMDDSFSIWVSEEEDSPFVFEILLISTREDFWIYKRNSDIRGSTDELFLLNESNIPYIKPEIQLLYKMDGSHIRDKDIIDFEKFVPLLGADEKIWLKKQLTVQGNTYMEHKLLK
ncbi:nucleotidyltransferase domain-containing protein [Corticicoccus populi]|uniref:Nucleotidyltransferase domain-containing protein n=1 Tax=Corticicoccus populi TaxID=1812821 RepID=A0ABW5WUX0_9STAP